MPTLPAKEIAASVEIVEIREGQIRDQLRDPESLLLPEDELPLEPPKVQDDAPIPERMGIPGV